MEQTEQPQITRRPRKRPRWRLHRLSILVLAVVLIIGTAAFASAQHLVEQHERDLLRQEASQIVVLFDQLGSSYQANLVGVAAIADVTEGDPAHFAADVAAIPTGGTWRLFRVGADERYETVTTVGEVRVDLAKAPASWQPVLERLASDGFAVLGLAGEDDARVIGLAARAGNMVAYHEIPLFTAAAQSAADIDDDDDLSFQSFDIGLYVGSTPTDEGLLFETGDPGPDAVQEVIEVGGTAITLVIGSKGDLGGNFTSWWPAMVVILAAACGIGMTTAIELVQRRRDDALHQVADLAEKNAALDAALEERRVAEAATAQVETELRQMQRLESVGQLAGGVAHDFNNLLAVMLSYADLIEAELPAEASGPREDLDQMREAARRGADLTRRLLQFSRHQPGDAVPVNVGALLSELSRLLERTIGEDVTLHVELDDHDCTAVLEAHSLEQAVLNLVINARDAVRPGGSITVATDRVVIDEEEASRTPGMTAGPHVRLRVTDDGEGMSPDVQRRAFDPFFTTKGRGQGTGLGLATVYGMVQSAGGHVGIRSSEGEGTEVTLLFPESGQPVPGRPAVPAGDSATHEGARVLLVEDEAAVRGAVRRMLESAGYAVIEAEDAAAAIDVSDEEDVDLLISDLVMPGALNGADVAEHLRSRDPDLPALFVTGYGADILESRGIEADGGATTVLQKPFTRSELLAAVGTALEEVR